MTDKIKEKLRTYSTYTGQEGRAIQENGIRLSPCSKFYYYDEIIFEIPEWTCNWIEMSQKDKRYIKLKMKFRKIINKNNTEQTDLNSIDYSTFITDKNKKHYFTHINKKRKIQEIEIEKIKGIGIYLESEVQYLCLIKPSDKNKFDSILKETTWPSDNVPAILYINNKKNKFKCRIKTSYGAEFYFKGMKRFYSAVATICINLKDRIPDENEKLIIERADLMDLDND